MVVIVLLDVSVPMTETVTIATTCGVVIMVEVVRGNVSKIVVIIMK